jgi:hypothetical protein
MQDGVAEVQEMAQTTNGPEYGTAWFQGLPYRFDYATCRRALMARQEDGDMDGMETLSNAIGIEPSAVRGFFRGRPPSLAEVLKILGVLHMKFEGVAKAIPAYS